MDRPLRDSVYLYGLHDPGGERHTLDIDVPGWIVFTEEVGSDPANLQGKNFSPYSDQALGVLVRLNAGYAGTGTLPFERLYEDFAKRCANYVRASSGARIWIVGNEPNHPVEWPGAAWDWNAQPPKPISPDKRGEPITPERYARCYKLVRTAIKAVSGHAGDQVLVAAPAPWNALLTYAGNASGDWVKYFTDLLAAIGAANCDGITLHTYTHGTDPALIRSEARLAAPYQNRRYHFRAYQDFMAAIPEGMRGLPVYITETDQGDDPWHNANTGWVRQAYDEINAWNLANDQKIRSVVLYRWPNMPGDRWGIEGKQGVIDDFRAALALRYRWEIKKDPQRELAAEVARLEAQVKALQPEVDKVAASAAAAARLDATALALAQRIKALDPAALRAQYAELEAAVTALENQLPNLPATGVPQPALNDLRGKLPAGAGAYPTRLVQDITQVIVHHTATRGDITPQRLAEVQVQQGKPGATYHFLINDDGAIHWMQPFEVATTQTNRADANAKSVAVALAGNFTAAPPGDAQLAAAAQLIAWLLSQRGLQTASVVGRRELENVASPGATWDTGPKFKSDLLAKVQGLLETSKDPYLVIQELRQKLDEAQRQSAGLQDQLAALQQQVQALNATVKTQATEIARLQDQIQGSTGGKVARPAIIDKVETLARHPTLPPYAKRTKPVSMLVVHHADTPRTTTVEQIAHYHVYGKRTNASGQVVKAEWPGIGYHFVVAPDGVIYQGQSESTSSYHVGGEPNNYSIGVSLIGRFMATDNSGKPQPAEAQVPTPEQLRSTAHLLAWLMQEYNVPLEQIKGHRDVWVGATSCPGETWKGGVRWYDMLVTEIRAVAQGNPARRMEHYLLLWDHGDAWAQADWQGAQRYIAHFRPTAGFSADDALLARHVTIVGGYAGVSGEDEVRLRAAGVDVSRLNGATEAETIAMLDALVAAGTPWPGAPAQTSSGKSEITAESRDLAAPGETPIPDEWTVPDDAVPPPAAPIIEPGSSVRIKVRVPPPTGPVEPDVHK